MANTTLMCTAPGCDKGPLGVPFESPKLTEPRALEVLRMHRADCHPPAEAPAVQGGQARKARPQAECVKRPTLSGQSIDQEEYDHFHYQFEQYKERLGDNMDNPARLLKCL
jgi:hypothetical protein